MSLIEKIGTVCFLSALPLAYAGIILSRFGNSLLTGDPWLLRIALAGFVVIVAVVVAVSVVVWHMEA